MAWHEHVKGSRRPYYNPVCLFFIVLKKMYFLQQLHYFQYSSGLWDTPYGKRHIPQTNLCCCTLNILDWSLHSPQSHCTTSELLKKTPCLCLHPVKLFLNFGHSAAPNPNNYVAALVLYRTQGSVRGLNRWEYKWLPFSPKVNVKQHRWRQNSYVFQVDH